MAAVRDREGTSVGRGWVVALGDCRDLLGEIAAVDHVITDPPYEDACHTKQRRLKRAGGVEMAPLDFVSITEEVRDIVGSHVSRMCARWALVFCQVEAAMTWREALSPLEYVRTCVWVKPDGMPQLTGDRPGMGYESIVACHPSGRKHWNGGGRVGVFEHNKSDFVSRVDGRAPHPTTKPLPLMTELVGLFTSPNDLILDPFAGSGTTGVAALRLGRRVILIEQDPKYAAICAERMQAEEQSSTLSALRAGQEPLFR